MAGNDAQYYLRVHQYNSLVRRLEDSKLIKNAMAVVKSAREEFETDWKHTSHAWYTTKENNPEVMRLLQQDAKRASSQVSETSHTLRLSTLLQRHKDNADRHEALLYCDLKLAGLSRILDDMRRYGGDANLHEKLQRRLSQGENGESSADLYSNEKRKMKRAMRMHTKLDNLPEGTFRWLSSSNKVGFQLSQQVAWLKMTTRLTEPEIERIVWTEYLEDNPPPPRLGEKEFRQTFDLLEKDDPKGWQEIQTWSRLEREDFDSWLDYHLTCLDKENAGKDVPASTAESRHPVWSRIKRSLSQKYKALSSKE